LCKPMKIISKAKAASNAVKALLSIGLLILVSAAYFSVGYRLMLAKTPPHKYIYPELNSLIGVYDCCGRDPNRIVSRINNTVVECRNPGLGISNGGSKPLVVNEFSCGHSELNGKAVVVNRKLVSVSYGWFFAPEVDLAITSSISTDGIIVFSINDAEIRDAWVKTSLSNLFLEAIFMGLFFSSCFFVWVSRR